MKRKCVKLMKSLLTTALAAAMVVTSNVVPFSAGPASVQAAEDSAYDDVVNAAHAAWSNYEWRVVNGSEGLTKGEIISEGTNWLDFQATSSAGNSMSNRALIYSTQAADKIRNGSIKATLSPMTTSDISRMGLLFRCTAQGDCLYFAYDPSQGWYLQRKAGNSNKKLLGSGVKIMAEPGEEITAEVQFEEGVINAWITYNGERTQVFENESTVATAGGSEIHAGYTGFMIGKYGSTAGAYVKDIEMTDTVNSDTFNGVYDWESDTWAPFDQNSTVSVVERDSKNYYEIQVDSNQSVPNAPVVTRNTSDPAYSSEPFRTGKIDTYFTDLGTANGSSSNFAIVYRWTDINNCAWVGYDSTQGWYWQTRVNGVGCYKTTGDKIPAPTVGETAHVTVQFDGTDVVVTVDDQVISDGWYTTAGNNGTLQDNLNSLPAGTAGFLMRQGHVQVHDYTVDVYDVDAGEDEIGIDPATISSDVMDVVIDKQFPRVQKYTFKDNGDTMWAQARGINTLEVNGTQVTVDTEQVQCEVSADSAVYTIPVNGGGVEAVITATLKVEDNIVSFDVNSIETASGTFSTLEIPGMLLASVTNQDNSAQLAYAQMSGSTTKKGDYFVDIDRSFTQTSGAYREYEGMYAFVSNDTFSAGLYSNSEKNNDLRVTASPGVAMDEEGNAFTYLGLRSSVWTLENQGVKSDLPSVSVIIARDENGNGEVDWQDGAIAYREIMHNPEGWETVKDMVTIRIVENFAGQAAHPFLETVDGIKRVDLATDGLGQQVLLKGYASEGHDSAHPDYGDIGTRIGGAEDLNELLQIAHEYGTEVGIHINASEGYPEADAFSEELMRIGSFGWNWVDESYSMNTMYDLTSGLRAQRLDSLREQLTDEDNLDFIYLDVWAADTWQTNKISQQFIERGWRCANEWGYANEDDATWNHWAVDVDYGGSGSKGINSDIMRFIRNHQKDSWQANYPAYGGTMVYPLLGGENSVSFEGWQRAKDFDTFVTVTFNDNVPTKFLQHYLVMEWENDETKSVEDGNTEKYIRLESEDGADEVEVFRTQSGGREIYYNGKMILTGEVNMNGGWTNASTEKYLIPWFWDADGSALADDAQKLYHWNRSGGETTWELPAEWSDVATVKVYKLTDTGRTEEQEIEAADGSITLDAEAAVPYVIYKGEKAERTFEEMDWGEGTGLVDPNFTSQTFEAWDVEGNDDGSAQIVKKSDNNNPVFQVADNAEEVSISQPITGLESGKTYMAYTGVDNRSDRKAYIEVTTADGTESNYATRSVVKTYVGVNAHNTEGTNSYMQNMPVIFTVPEDSTDAVLTLRVEAGAGTVQFDELRVVEVDESEVGKWTDENVFEQDFEHNIQGLYPFVVGDHQGRPTDVKVHLSEKNEPYTQIGWNDRIVDDVIDGDWSVKAHQLTSLGGLVYQTIPQTYRFEEGVEYTVTFQYEQGMDDTYAFVVGEGEHIKANGKNDSSLKYYENLKAASDPVGTYTYTFTPDSDEWWIGIYSNEDVSVTESSAGSKPWKMGAADIILDNLKIVNNKETEEPEEPAGEISTAILEYAIGLAEGASTDGVVDAVKENFDNALQNAKDVLARVQEGDASVTQNEVDAAWSSLIKAMQYLEFKKGDKTDLEKVIALADEMNSNLDAYLDAGKDAFTAALAEAKDVYADGNAMEDDVDTAWRNLMDAMAELRLRPDKDLLEDLINQAEGLNEADYEAESFAAVSSALEEAKDVFANENATQEEVDESSAALKSALAKLTPVSTEEDDSQNQAGGSSDKNTNSSSAGNTSASNSSAVKTGDTANVLPFAAAAVLAAGAVVILKRKKEEN